MHVNMLVRLKSYKIDFLKVELTHPGNVFGSRITPIRNRTRTGLSDLRITDSPRGIFDSQLEQHKVVEESREENKNQAQVYSDVKLSMF